MGKFFSKFQDSAAYNTAKSSLVLPHVSLIDGEGIAFDPKPTPTPTIEMVDLGLPSGLLWAKTNLGAQSETDYGDYYQWAATTPLHVEGTIVNPAADWSLCPYCTDGEGETFEKYYGNDYPRLELSDDAATAILGAGYRMPTQTEFQELIEETNNEWTTIDGVNGHKFTNKSDPSKYIFLPAAGYCDDSHLYSAGEGGYYWSSSLFTDEIPDEAPRDAWRLDFYSRGIELLNDFRYLGISIRPVCSAL